MVITSLTRHILEIMVSKFSNIMININKVIGNRSTFFSGGVTLCTREILLSPKCRISGNVNTLVYFYLAVCTSVFIP